MSPRRLPIEFMSHTSDLDKTKNHFGQLGISYDTIQDRRLKELLGFHPDIDSSGLANVVLGLDDTQSKVSSSHGFTCYWVFDSKGGLLQVYTTYG